jgi:hypothetical protein
MFQQRVVWPVALTAAVLCFVALPHRDRAATIAAEPKANPSEGKDAVEGQIKELQKQVADLKTQMSELQKNRIVAAGTATWTRPELQANKTNTRVKLPADIVAGLGKDYVVLLTSHYPKGGFPFFSAYWKLASDGIDITLVDVQINDGTTASYGNPNTEYLIDWVIVKR